MDERFQRTKMLIGEQGLAILRDCTVAVFGLGGVGGNAVECLARSGIGSLALFDHDTIALSNLNRQIFALASTVGEAKTEAAKRRIADINPQCKVEAHKVFYTKDNAQQYDLSKYDYIIDAIDTVSAKLELIERAKKAGVKIISCMGTGNKLDPSRLRISDISKTSVCPLARVMRKELLKRNIVELTVVFSDEMPQKQINECLQLQCDQRKIPPASIAFVPSAAGILLCSFVVRELLKKGS